MTVTSYGYPDQIAGIATVDSIAWAGMWEHEGHSPIVETSGSWAGSGVTGSTVVRVAVGTGSGKGIFDVTDRTYDVPLSTSSGSAKYWVITARRDWSAGQTTFAAVGGGTTNALPGGLNNTPGVLHDTPLHLWRVDVGVIVPTMVADYRVTRAQSNKGWGPWIAVSLADNTLTYPGFGKPPAYAISVDGSEVKLRGTIARTLSILDGAILFTLPPEATPNSNTYHMCAAERLGTVTGQASGDGIPTTNNEAYSMRGSISSAGVCVVVGDYRPTFVSLDGWRFDRS